MGGWIFLGIIFFIALVYLVVMRRVESGRIEKKFEKKDILLTSYGVNYFGLSSEESRLLRSSGVLVLLKSGLYYRAKFLKRELFIPGSRIKALRVVEFHKGKPLYQKAVAIDFINKDGNPDTAVFRIPFPDKWLGAISKIR